MMRVLRICGRPAMIAIAAAAIALQLPAAADEQAAPHWFGYSKGVDAAWRVTRAPDAPMKVAIERRDRTRATGGYRVLVLYPRPSSAYDIAITRILREFDHKQIDASFVVVNFDMKDDKAREALDLAEGGQFNLIFAMGSESTAWLYQHYRGGRIPVVSVCSKDPVLLGQAADYQSGSGTNFAFTSLNMPIDVQMTYVKELKPNLKNLTVLVDSSNFSAMQTQAEPITTFARQRGMQVIQGVVRNPGRAREELIKIVRDAVQTMRKSDPDLSNSLFLVTGSTSVFLQIRAINENADRVPVVSVVPEIVKQGADTATLAIGISFESNADLAAVYATDILRGRSKAADLAVGVVTPPDIAISFLKAREIGLRIPFSFFEAASYVYDYEGRAVRSPETRITAQ
jgi:putative ABC transport system substrate-binding protein